MTKRHFTDLTAIDCPFGELDDDTQARLKAWLHGVKWSDYGEQFFDTDREPRWFEGLVYRAQPAPFKEVGTLAEIGAQVGDVVESGSGWVHTLDHDDIESFMDDDYRIIRRASDAKPAGPVITETVKRQRIIPGIYGRVSIHELGEHGIQYFALVDSVSDKERTAHVAMNAAELRAAIATLTEIADALEGGAK
jgi:hypothetical protein